MQLAQITQQLEVFKSNLEEFATKYAKQIRKNPTFRQQFQVMCGTIGVDPLASTKGFWSELLGVGDFYYELSVQVVEVCLATRASNGGFITMQELMTRLTKRRGAKAQAISEDDIERAIKKLKTLGRGFDILVVGKQRLVRSVPTELNADQTVVLAAAQTLGYVTESSLVSTHGWSAERISAALNQLLREGIVWVDDQGSERSYWPLSLQQTSG
ncbi:vacuolar-sorting protein SNF8, variant [Capsaspora owczarzaki ATCC 30864]|nr:vacuolar-sorting protein SNF8, variant [Capsaspora owczarzaki ATCC 30864]|eukprot:XP_011270237.1 vacuolar-sorting protein SNF8, variant [Capsaspora owczarzaki ATCC 30864]